MSIAQAGTRNYQNHSRYWGHRFSLACKRALDICVSGFLLLLLAPFLFLLGLAVKLTSPGNVFYRWRVVGRGGRPFTGYKIRSMCSNADTLKAELANLNEMRWPVFKLTKDPRVTKIAGWMRTTNFEALPQTSNGA